jgi:hypothetical protein
MVRSSRFSITFVVFYRPASVVLKKLATAPAEAANYQAALSPKGRSQRRASWQQPVKRVPAAGWCHAQGRLRTMIRHFICALRSERSLALMTRAGAPQAVSVLPAAMGQASLRCLLMAPIGLAELGAPRRLPASFATVDLAAIAVGTDEKEGPAGAAKTLAKERFRGSRHRCREGLDSRDRLLAR